MFPPMTPEEVHSFESGLTRALELALQERDSYTKKHSDRVVLLSWKIAKARQVSRRDLFILGVGASFHDIGKIGIPDQVLLKPGRFTEAEYEVMKSHPIKGEHIVEVLEIPDADRVAEAVRHHHERFDGTGYPDGLAGEDIPWFSRILSIADSYDAMTSRRNYRHALPREVAIRRILDGAGGQFDPDFVDAFAGLVLGDMES